VTLTASVGAISGQAVITLIPGSPATIELVATPTSAPADGQTEIRVTATVRDANGNAVPNVQVDFSSIPPLNITSTRVTTDSTGQATTSIIAPTQSGTYTLVAKAGAISKSISLEFLSGAASTIALSAERTQLLVTLPARYGSTDYSVLSPFSRTIITAAVRDENGNPVRGAVVQFQTNYGIIQATATTNDQGVAQAVFNAPSIAPPGSVTITAQSGGATASLDLTVIPGPPAKVRMSAFPLALPADGRTRSQLQIEVRDANDNLVPDGTQVELTLNPERFGSIQSPVATVNGIAASVYIPSTQTGEVTITAVAKRSFILDGQEYRFATDPNDPYSTARVRIFVGAQIQIVRTAPNFRTEISVSSSPSTDPAQRKSLRTRSPIENTSDLTLQLVDGQGNNIATSGVQIRVRANDSQVLLVEMQGGQETGNLSLQELTVLTDSSGRASVRYYASPIAGNVQVTAELLDPQGVAFTSDMITITQRPGDPAIITVPTPSPNLIFVPGAGTPIQTTITAQVFDSVNNPVESGISVRFEATLAGRSVGIFTPSAALTDSSGRASTTLTSTPDTGIVTVTATASVAGQQRPATGSTTVGFVTGVTAISVTAQNSYIGGAPDDNIPDSTVVTAQFTGAIPDGTRVIFSTTRGTFDPQSPVPIRQKVAAVTRNTAQVTLYAEVVTVTTIANVSVSVLDSQGQTVTGRVDVNIVPEPGPVILEPIQVARDTLVVSTTNSTNPNQRLPLDPNLPNSTTVTVSVREQGTNRPVQNAVVTLSSDDPNTLWVVGNTAKLTTIQVVTDSNGQGQASFYASTKARKVTITAEFDPGTGIQRKTATINQVPGPALLTVRSNFTTIFVRLPDTFTTADGQVHNYANLPGNSNNKAQITAVVADANGNPYADITVTFSATDGVVAQSAVTDSNGEAVVDYSPPVATPSGGQVTIVAQATVSNQTLNNQTTLQVRSGPPAIVQIASNPTELPADGTSTAVVTATVQDANGNLVRDGVSVELKLTSRPASDTKWLPSGTDTITLSTVNGQVSAILVAGLKAGVAAVRATASEIAANTTYKSSNVPDLTIPIGVQLQPIQIDQTKVFVSKDENGNPFPPRDGFTYDNDAVVKVKVQTPQGQGVENATVVLTSSDPNTLWRVGNKVTKQTVQVLTDLNGEAQATFLASQRAGTVTITASVGPQSQQMTIVQQVGPPVVRIVANPAEIFVRMVSAQYDILPQQSQIVVSVSDPNNNPHPNAAVQLTASAGTLSATSGQTNANGQFIVTLTAPNQPTQISLRVDSAVTERGERPDPNDPRNKFTETVTVNPGPPTLLALSADRLVVQAKESAIITATVQDPNGNPVRDGINVTFRLTAAPEGTSINPTSGTTTNGQASTTLTAGNVAGTATIEAEAVDVVVGHFFRATNRLNIAVGVTVALQRMEIITKTLVVSDTDATDPALRKPLDPNKENKTIVRVQVSGTSGLPIPVILDSSDSKSLWVDRRDTTRRALKQITLTVDANGEAEAIFYASTTRALSNNPVTIRVSLDPTFPANQTLSDTIVQEPGPPSKIALTLTGFSRAADGTPYLTIPSTGTVSGTFTATVTDANNNGVPNVKVKFALTPDLGGDEGTLSSSEETTDIDGKTPTITLTASNFSTEVTLTATADGASTSQKIRYSVSLTGVSIVGNPPQIPDDGVTTSTIVITGTPAFRQGLKFKLSADLGSTLTADGVTDARSLTVIVGNNDPAGEGSNEARAILKGPQPDLSQTTNRTITITATLIVDGTPRDFTGTITLLPRIQIVSDFGLSNNPNQLVVSSSNDLNPANRISLDGVVGHNKAKLQVIVNGAAAPNPRLVVISSTDGSVLFEVTKGDNVGVRNLGNISGNLVQERERWIYEVTLYSSTLASPSVIVNFSVLGVNRNITYEQLPGLPAQVTVLPERFVIGVTGHPSLPTSTNVQAIVRDAVGNLVTTPGVTVYFTADAGLLNPPSAPAIGGYAMTTLTSTNETRQVRVFARAVAPSGAEAIGVSTVVFAVGQVNIIELRADRPADLQGNIPVPAGEIVRITAIFSPSGQVPDNVRVQVSLVGAYGIVQSVSPTLNDRTEIVIVNNNTNDFDSNTRVRVYVYEQTGQLIASPEMTLVMKGVTTPPVVSLATDLGADNVRDGVPDNNPIVVSNTNDTNKTLRSPLPPHAGGPSVNVTTLILTVRGLSDETEETVEVSLQSTDPNGLFVFPTNQNTGELGKLSPTQIKDNSENDRDLTKGVIQVTVEYYASRKAQTVIINAEVKRGDQLHGRASITVVQDAGRVEKAFFTVDPPRLAVNTLLNREPVEARLIATLLDANDNPVPNERVSFAIEPIQVVPYADITAGNRTNVILTRYDLPSLTEVFDPNVVSPRRFYQTLDPVLYITPLFPPANGVITDFIEILRPLPRPGSVIVVAQIRGNTVFARDDGNGNISGPYVADGSVDYDTGAIAVSYEIPPDAGTNVYVIYENATFTGRLTQVPVRPSTIIVQTTIDNNIELLWDTGGGTISGNRGSGTIDYNTGDITVTFDTAPDAGAQVVVSYESERFRNAWGSGGVPFTFAYIGRRRFVPPGQVFDPTLESTPSEPPLVSDGSIYPQSEGITDANGVTVTFFRSFNVSQPVRLKMVPQSRQDLMRRFDTFYYVPVQQIQYSILQGGLVNPAGSTFTIEFRFFPSGSLPVGSRVWVRIHGFAYDWDEDHDGKVNEDPPGTLNPDDDFDGRVDEDPNEPQNPVDNDGDGRQGEDPPGAVPGAGGRVLDDDDGDGIANEDLNPMWYDRWFTVEVTEPDVIRLSITNSTTGPDWVDGWKVIQVFVWNKDGIRLMAQTSAIEFH
jgi:protocatechuate 3,4-dioxygenase beta subunit